MVSDVPVTVRRVEFSNFEVLRDAVQDAPVDIVQLERGKMSGTLTHLSIGSIGVSTGNFSRGLRSLGNLSDHRVAVGMVTEAPAVWQGVEAAPGDIVVVAPGHELHARYAAANTYVATFIEQHELFVNLERQQPEAADAAVWRQSASVLCADPAVAAVRAERFRTLLGLISLEGPTMSAGTAEFFRREILKQVTVPMLDGIKYREPPPLRQSEVKLVREVERYLIEAGSRPVHLSELLETFGVHERALYRAFDHVLGIPPITFQRHKRLGDVHAVLLAGGPELMLKDIAKEHGFLDYPRFAREYRRLFGEKPSHTMRRDQRPARFRPST